MKGLVEVKLPKESGALSELVSGSSMNSRTSISNTESRGCTVLYLATSMALVKASRCDYADINENVAFPA
jgi:hypothetical protein